MPLPTSPLPPNPSLVAILLVIKTRAGPRIAYHYPPLPAASAVSSSHDPSWYGTPGPAQSDAGSDGSQSSDWTDSGDEDAGDGASSRAASGGAASSIERSGGGGGGSRALGSALGSVRSGGRGGVRSSGISGPATGLGDDVDEDVLEGATAREARDGAKRDGRGARANGAAEANRRGSPGREGEVGLDWEHLLGFSAKGLAKVLSPGRGFNKRRFEFGIEHLVFLGAPRFVREDGQWKKKRRTKRRDASSDAGDETISNGAPASPKEPDTPTVVEPPDDLDFEIRNVPGYDPAYGHGLMSGAASEMGSETRSVSTNGNDSDLTMFNVVFVLNPPALEYHVRVEEMYDNVVKKFAKALKYAQAFNNYVSIESRAIIAMKEKAKESRTPIAMLWPNIVSKSSLAKAIMITFNTISHDKIAHVNLGQDFDTSFQIPQALSTPFIPTATEPQMPGLWLTTATLLDDEDTDTMLSPHSALLLLEDEEILLKEVESDAKELSGPLSYFIRNLTPTKSLQKISKKYSLSLKDVQLLARHMIYWRRARAIPPLRWQDTYIVSPNADMRALKTAIPQYASKFPTLPSLPIMLHWLSGPPRQYSSIPPTVHHRAAYMDILAWLMRGGWVTQLRTFGWVRVPPEVKAAVAVKMELESRMPKNSDRSIGSGSSPRVTAVRGRSVDGHDFDRGASASPLRREVTGLDSPSVIASPLMPSLLAPPRPPSETGSASSGRTNNTTIPPFSPIQRPQSSQNLNRPPPPLSIKQSPLVDSASNAADLPSPTSSARALDSPSSSSIPATSNNSVNGGSAYMTSAPPASSAPTASIINSPQKAIALESRWIEHIGATFTDPELMELWPVLLKYFDGRHALEEISVREGLKKNRVGMVLKALCSGGWLMTVRHW